MEEILSLIFQGCKLAKDLESNIPNLVNQPNILSSSFDDIIRVFSDARDRLNICRDTISTPYTTLDQETIGGAAVEEWLRYNSNYSSSATHQQIMDTTILHHAQVLENQKMSGFDVPESSGGLVQPPPEVVDSARGTSSQRIRRSDAEKTTVRVAAPRMGNTEIPPEDGYIWRKYGQKEILGSRFPRGYYRCTHQKLYHCPAKKQVQRLDDDPNTFEIIYRGDHTCTTSSTAPSTTPPATGHNPAATSHWLSMDIQPSMESSTISSLIDMHMYRLPEFGLISGGAGPSGGGGRVGRDDIYHPVVDLADVMFNSGSSSSNSMDIIFSSNKEDKWEAGEKRN